MKKALSISLMVIIILTGSVLLAVNGWANLSKSLDPKTCLGVNGGTIPTKKPIHEWDSHRFVSYINEPIENHLSRWNIINIRNKYAYIKYDSQKDKSVGPIFLNKSFSQGVYLAMKNLPNLKCKQGLYGKTTVKSGDSLLIWYTSDFTPYNYKSAKPIDINSKGDYKRDYQDFDCLNENGKIVYYKLFKAGNPGVQKLINRVYDKDKVLYWNMTVTVEP